MKLLRSFRIHSKTSIIISTICSIGLSMLPAVAQSLREQHKELNSLEAEYPGMMMSTLANALAPAKACYYVPFHHTPVYACKTSNSYMLVSASTSAAISRFHNPACNMRAADIVGGLTLVHTYAKGVYCSGEKDSRFVSSLIPLSESSFKITSRDTYDKKQPDQIYECHIDELACYKSATDRRKIRSITPSQMLAEWKPFWLP